MITNMKIPAKPGEFPRRSRRLKWYVEEQCRRLLKQDCLSQEDIDFFWEEINKRKSSMPFPWQRENLRAEAAEGLTILLSQYRYDPDNRIYTRKT